MQSHILALKARTRPTHPLNEWSGRTYSYEVDATTPVLGTLGVALARVRCRVVHATIHCATLILTSSLVVLATTVELDAIVVAMTRVRLHIFRATVDLTTFRADCIEVTATTVILDAISTALAIAAFHEVPAATVHCTTLL